MIIGDYEKFGFLIEYDANASVDPTFIEGFFVIYINGKMYPEKFNHYVTLNRDVEYLLNNSSFIEMPINKRLFEIDKKQAIVEMFMLSNILILDEDNREDSDNLKEDYTYNAISSHFTDGEYGEIFSVSNGEMIRILGGKLLSDYDEEKCCYINYRLSDEIDEIFILKYELEYYISKLKKYYTKIKQIHKKRFDYTYS
ncbi:Imm42 family immunity protein [Stenoxybacter acetivorans]|uniref:Imm42 family immunity protein n=1 Tax=Stenoxybacter acetivorans TaxID=422441 RepID=UPI00068AC991|nr:Imm42 family immunity protein [Stenoxybacter acetivorans]